MINHSQFDTSYNCVKRYATSPRVKPLFTRDPLLKLKQTKAETPSSFTKKHAVPINSLVKQKP